VTVDNLPLTPGTPQTVTISPPAPWTVSGQVTAAAQDKPILAMAYQVADGPVNSFPVPQDAANPANKPVAASFSFPLTASDISANGTYPVTIFAWDREGAGQFPTFNVVAVNFPASDPSQPAAPPPPPPPPGGTP
jgi:hypothetical protein